MLALGREPEAPPIEVGRVLVWEPGPRLAFTYRGDTEVEVRFEASEHGTRVVLEHRGFDRSLAPDLSDDWAGLLDRFADRSHASASSSGGSQSSSPRSPRTTSSSSART